jgi:hypothetical protein
VNDLHGKRINVELQSQTMLPNGDPFVSLTVGESSILMDPGECRNLGLLMIEFATGAEADAAILDALELNNGTHSDEGAAFLQKVAAAKVARRKRRLEARPTVN